MKILFKYSADVENCESFRGFGYIYIYIYYVGARSCQVNKIIKGANEKNQKRTQMIKTKMKQQLGRGWSMTWKWLETWLWVVKTTKTHVCFLFFLLFRSDIDFHWYVWYSSVLVGILSSTIWGCFYSSWLTSRIIPTISAGMVRYSLLCAY